jgi:hypothetical protein
VAPGASTIHRVALPADAAALGTISPIIVLLAIAAGVALLLGVIGIYGAMSYQRLQAS